MWSKYVTRRLAVQVAQAWNFGWGEAMRKVYGVSVKNTLVFRDHKKTEYYVDSKQHERYVTDLHRLLTKDFFIKNFHKKAQKDLEDILNKVSKRLSGINLEKVSNRELLQIYRNFILPNVEQFYVRMWTVFNIGEPLANVIRVNLRKYLKDEKEVNEVILKLSSPLKPNDVLQERMDLLKIAIQKNKLSKSEIKSKVRNHTKKYRHIPMFDFDHEPYPEEHFFKELKNIKNPAKELRELKSLFKSRQEDFKKILIKIKPDKKFKLLLNFLKSNVFLRDYRDMIRQKLNLELRSFYEEAGKRLKLDVSEVATLTNDEIKKYLRNNKSFPKDIIKQRKNYYLLIQKSSKVEMYSGARGLAEFKKRVKNVKLTKVNILSGTIGSVGVARGRAKLVYTNKDLNKIKKGDILITSMTRQDFVPALRLARAVVTDEGSVTAHAAIIARELKIPCLVNTKKAMEIFKDGDMVEVDANKGIVKKI